jgi:hypothetical protein
MFTFLPTRMFAKFPPALRTDGGAVLPTPDGPLELRPLCRGAWEWVGADPTRRPLVRAPIV